MLNIYTNSVTAAEKLLPESIFALAIVREEEMAENQFVAFTPDLNVASFDILNGPMQAQISVAGKVSPLTFSPEDGKSIGDVVLGAIHGSKISGSSQSAGYNFKPKK